MTLVLATDSAYPYDFAQRPSGCAAILGYVGRPGYTPRVWSHGEAAAARATGCAWWPIGVGISRGATSAQDGHDLAAYMIGVLPGYSVSKTTPVFQDLEPDALRADTTRAGQCVAAWKADMRAAGYTRPYTYSVDAPFIDWMARWDNIRPATLPAGKIGVQYSGSVSPPNYDLSVFDPSLLVGEDGMTQADIDAINAHTDQQLKYLWQALGGTDNSVYSGGTTAKDVLSKLTASVGNAADFPNLIVHGDATHPNSLDAIAGKVDGQPTLAQIKAAVAAVPAVPLTPEQVTAIAEAVAAAQPAPPEYHSVPVPPA